jgi:hypothetical protein
MGEEYEDELVTSHSDENPELNPDQAQAGDNPLAAYTTEGSAVSELYTQDRGRKKLLGVRPEEMDHILEYEDNEGNYWEKQ